MKKFLTPLVLAALVFAVYAPALHNGFVWDDTALILRDPLIRSWRLLPEGFQHFLFTDATPSDFYRPMQRATYVFDYGLFAFRPGGYHFTSIFFHIAATLALLLFSGELLRLFGVEERRRRLIAFLAGVVWAIHPVHTAAVVYISGRADPLAAAFGFIGLYCGIRSLRRAGAARWLLLLAAGVLLLMSLLSKETGIVFPFFWAAILLLRKDWKGLQPVAVVALFVAVIYLSLRLPAEHFTTPRFRTPPPALVRPILAARAFAEYAGLILLPLNLHMDRDVETRPEGAPNQRETSAAWREVQTLLGLLLIGAAIYWLWRSRKQEPAILCCLILAALAYLPASGALLLNANVAEHWIYLPTAFLFLAAGLAISRLPISRPVVGSVLGLWIAFLGVRTCLRTFDWKDQRTFLERTIANGGNSARMLINLASQELHDGQLDSAREHLRQALLKEPDQPLAVINLAVVAIRQSDYTTARELLDRATQMPFVDAQAHELLAILKFKETGEVDLMRMRLSSRTGPPNWRIEKRYVEVLDSTGNTDKAIAELKSCLVTQWYRAESWELLSTLLAKAGRSGEAIKAKQHAELYDVHLGEAKAP